MDTNKSKKTSLTSPSGLLSRHLPRSPRKPSQKRSHFSNLFRASKQSFSIKQTTQHQNYYRNFTIACGAFLLAFIAVSLFAPVSNSSAEQQVLASITDGEYSVAVTGQGTVNLDVGQPSSSGKTVKATDTLSIAANAPEGYKLYVSMDNATSGGNRLYRNGDSSSSFLAPNNSSGQDIPIGSETTLTSNSWGFTTDATKYNNNQFAAMPLSNNIALISQASVSGNYTQNIYYGVNANTDIISGSYSGNVVYTVTSDSIPGTSGIQSIDPGTIPLAGGKSINIIVSLFSTAGITTPDDLGTITVAIDNNDCPITNKTLSGANIIITCTAPANTEGAKPLAVTIQKFGQTYGGEITYKDLGPDPTFNSISPNNLTINNSTTKVALNLTVSNKVTSVSDLGTISATIGGTTCSSPSSTLSGTTLTVVCTAPSSSSAKTSNVAITISGYNKTYTLSNAFSYRSKAFSSLTTMQQLTSTICSNAGVGETASLRDSRGYGNGGGSSTAYGVIKALDGNCWMTDNLNLYNKTISSSDSDTTSSFTIPASSNWSNNEYSAAKVHVADGTGSQASSDSKYYGQSYYNWCAATAQTSCSGTSTVTTSICPKNWNLPTYASATSTTNGDWGKLITAYKTANGGTLTGPDLITTTTTATAYPLGFRLYYGYWYYYYNSELYQGSSGRFWSARPGSSPDAYGVYYNSSDVNRYNDYKGNGLSVRCVVPSS